MIAATFDPAKELTLYFRVARNGSLTFSFVDSDGNAYSLIYDDFELNIYKNQGDKKKLISLIVGSGISFPTASSLTVSITESQSNINEGEYYYELYRPDIGKTWLTGDAIFHNGKFDGVDNNATITITESGTPVTITISAGGGGEVADGTLVLSGSFDSSGDVYPSGTISKGEIFISNGAGTPNTKFGESGAWFVAIVNNPGQTGSNWYVLYPDIL